MKPIFAQVAGYGVGNTINLTPAMRAAAEVLDEPVELWVETESLLELFRGADFVKLEIGKPPRKPFLTSADVLLKPGKPDWLGAYLKVREELGHPGPCPPPYVDRPDAHLKDFPEVAKQVGPFAVLLRGAASAKWHAKKDPGDTIYREAADRLTKNGWPVLLGGNQQDREWWPEVWPFCIDVRGGGLRRQLALLAEADVVVANDTGLAHAAAAMGKPTLVFWKDTDLRKNRAQSPAVVYARKENWSATLEAWVEAVSPAGGDRLAQVKIWGLKRSGTNWLRWLIDENFRARALMDVLGWKHGKPSEPLSWRWQTWFPEWRPNGPPGGSRTLSEALQASLRGELRHVCIVKHPLAWLDSMARYEGLRQIGTGWAQSKLRLWQARTRQMIGFTWASGSPRALVRYETLLTDLEAGLRELGFRLELEKAPRGMRDFTRRLERGNDGMGREDCAKGAHNRAYWLEERYLEGIPGKVIRQAKRSLDKELLEVCGYEVHE